MTKLKLISSASTSGPSKSTKSTPFTWEPPLPLHPSSPTAIDLEAKSALSPPFHPLPSSSMDTFGSRPIDDWTGSTEGGKGKGLVRCRVSNGGCGNVIMEGGFEQHAKTCAENMARSQAAGSSNGGAFSKKAPTKKNGKAGKRNGLEASPTPSESPVPTPKRIKLIQSGSSLSSTHLPPGISSDDPDNPSSMTALIWLESEDRYESRQEQIKRLDRERKMKGGAKKGAPTKAERTPFHLDRHCACPNGENKFCTRSIDKCKLHSLLLRKAVKGRSDTFDNLVEQIKLEEAKALAMEANGKSGAGPGSVIMTLAGERKRRKLENGGLAAGGSQGDGGEGDRDNGGEGGAGGENDEHHRDGQGSSSIPTPVKSGRKRKPKPAPGEELQQSHISGSGKPHRVNTKPTRMDDPDQEFFDLIYGAKYIHSKVVDRARARVYDLPPYVIDTHSRTELDRDTMNESSGDVDADGDVDMDAAGEEEQPSIPNTVPPPTSNPFSFLQPQTTTINRAQASEKEEDSSPSKDLNSNNNNQNKLTTTNKKPSSKQKAAAPVYLPDLLQCSSFGGGAAMGTWHLQRRQESTMEGMVIGLVTSSLRRRKAAESQMDSVG